MSVPRNPWIHRSHDLHCNVLLKGKESLQSRFVSVDVELELDPSIVTENWNLASRIMSPPL